ncbi:MAG: hypothetical protein Q4G36_08330 [Paracoccus sp. (in: a-proteobacteria)]|nr:hypothetical protein [Paracoccus sp. (in: a-proteobacteria)]
MGQHNRRHASILIAFAFAMRCRLGEADGEALGRATVATSDALGLDDPLTRAVAGVARRWPDLRHNRAALEDAGAMLMRAAERACWPVPDPRMSGDL